MSGSNDFTINMGATWKGAGAVGSAKKDILSMASVADETARKWSQLVSQAVDSRSKLASIEKQISSSGSTPQLENEWLNTRRQLVATTTQLTDIERQAAAAAKQLAGGQKELSGASDKTKKSFDDAAAAVDAAAKRTAAFVVASSSAMMASEAPSQAAFQYARLAAEVDKARQELVRIETQIAKTGGFSKDAEYGDWEAARNQLKAARDGMKQMEGQFLSSEKNSVGPIKRISDAIKGFGIALAPLAAAGYTIAKAGRAFYEFVRDGAGVAQVGESFKNLNANIIHSPDLLDKMRKASGGTIDDMTLMSNIFTLVSGASDDMTRRLADSAPRLLEIAKAAAKLNPTLGDTTFMYESLARGIKRSEFRLIDNLGLNVRINEANEKYAASLGKTVESLSAEERQQALLNEVLRVGDNLIRQAGGSTESAVDSYKQMEAASVNLTNELKRGVHMFLEQTGIVRGLAAAFQHLADKAKEANDREQEFIDAQDAIVAFKGFSQGFGDSAEVTEKNLDRITAAAQRSYDAVQYLAESGNNTAGAFVLERLGVTKPDQEAVKRMTDLSVEFVKRGIAPTIDAAVDLAIQLERMSMIDPLGYEQLKQSEQFAEVFGLTAVKARDVNSALADMSDRADELGMLDRIAATSKFFGETHAQSMINAAKRTGELQEAIKQVKRELEARSGDAFTAAINSDLLRAAAMHGRKPGEAMASEKDVLAGQIAATEAVIAAQDYAAAQKELKDNTDPTKQEELALKVMKAREAMLSTAQAAELMNGKISSTGDGTADFSNVLRENLMQALYDSADAAGVGVAGLAALQGFMGNLDDDAILAAVQLAAVTEQIKLLGPAMATAIEDGMDPQEAARQAALMVEEYINGFKKKAEETPPVEVPIKTIWQSPAYTRGDTDGRERFENPVEQAKREAVNLKDYVDRELMSDANALLLDYTDVSSAQAAVSELKRQIEDFVSGGYTINIKVNYESGPLPPPPPPTGSSGGLGWSGSGTGGRGGFSFAGGSGGVIDFGAGSPAVLHGREAVLTEAQLGSLIKNASNHGDGRGPTITINNFNRKSAAISNALVRSYMRGRISSYMGGA